MKINITSLYIEDSVLCMVGGDGKIYKTGVAPLAETSENTFSEIKKEND